MAIHTNNNNLECILFFRVTSANSFMLAAASAAARRRQRRVKQDLRHERLTVAMALAEYNHHSAPRRPTISRARGEESEMNNATGQKTSLPRAANTQSTLRWTTTGMCLPPGRHLSLSCGHSRGFCDTPWRTSWISRPSCRPSMILCRRWEGGTGG